MRSVLDVAVIGAGPAGSATALRLADSGCRVALIERTRLENPRVGESLAPSVQPLLADLVVWQEFLRLQPLPSYGTRSVWGADTPEVHSHMSSPWGCGWHVDRTTFDHMLANAAVKAGATLLRGTSFIDCQEQDSGWLLILREHGAGSAARHKDAWSLAQAKGIPSLIYHEPVLRVRFIRGAAGTTRILTIRDLESHSPISDSAVRGLFSGHLRFGVRYVRIRSRLHR